MDVFRPQRRSAATSARGDERLTDAGAASASATWDALAARYVLQERLERRAIAAALRLADPGPPDRLVDLATGTGVLLRALATRDRRPAVALGVDRSAGMLSRVGRLPEGWHVIQGDARAVPLPDGHADVVTCTYLLHLLDAEDRARVLREARRLLRAAPGSRLLIVTAWADPGTPGGRVLSALLRRAAQARPTALGGLMPLDPAPELAAAGLAATHRIALSRGGYSSLVLRARPL